jgi:hypothetical protein
MNPAVSDSDRRTSSSETISSPRPRHHPTQFTNLAFSLGAMQGEPQLPTSAAFHFHRGPDADIYPPLIISFIDSVPLRTVAKRLPMDDPTFINYLRIAYIAAQLISLGIYLYIQAQVGGVSAVLSAVRERRMTPTYLLRADKHPPRSRRRTT